MGRKRFGRPRRSPKHLIQESRAMLLRSVFRVVLPRPRSTIQECEERSRILETQLEAEVLRLVKQGGGINQESVWFEAKGHVWASGNQRSHLLGILDIYQFMSTLNWIAQEELQAATFNSCI